MMKRYFVAGYRILLALLTLMAVAVQFNRAVLTNGANPVNFFSFFTVESNLLAILTFLITGVAVWMKSKEDYSMLRGAVTLSMTVTGIVYVLLLSGNEAALQTTIPWVNNVVHYLMPIALLVDWLLDPPKRRIGLRRALVWLSFPLGYFVYSLLRGPLVNWYPYPFIDPRVQGYGKLILNSGIIAVAVIGLTAILSAVAHPRRRA